MNTLDTLLESVSFLNSFPCRKRSRCFKMWKSVRERSGKLTSVDVLCSQAPSISVEYHKRNVMSSIVMKNDKLSSADKFGTKKWRVFVHF